MQVKYRALLFSPGIFQLRIELHISCVSLHWHVGFFTTEPPVETTNGKKGMYKALLIYDNECFKVKKLYKL